MVKHQLMKLGKYDDEESTCQSFKAYKRLMENNQMFRELLSEEVPKDEFGQGLENLSEESPKGEDAYGEIEDSEEGISPGDRIEQGYVHDFNQDLVEKRGEYMKFADLYLRKQKKSEETGSERENYEEEDAFIEEQHDHFNAIAY